MSEQALAGDHHVHRRDASPAWRRLRWSTRIAALTLVLLVAGAVLAPWISPHHPDVIDLSQRLAPMSATHWLGADHLGRDIFSRLLAGARVSLGAVAVSLALIISIGVAAGGAAGYLGGRADQVIMRVTDVFLTFPTTVMALFMIGVLGTGLTNVIIAIVVTHWAWYARMTRGVVLSIRSREFIAAARVAGAGPVAIFVRRLLPGVLVQLLVLASLDIGHIMLHVSGLSFLGLGVAPPSAEWGVMMADARQLIWSHPMLVFWPGFALFVTVMACNILGDALRDRLDPALAAEHGH